MLKYGVILLSLTLFWGCATVDPIVQPGPAVLVTSTVTRYAPVDPSLLTLYEAIPETFKTNGELLEAFNEANKRLTQCAADKVELAKLLGQ